MMFFILFIFSRYNTVDSPYFEFNRRHDLARQVVVHLRVSVLSEKRNRLVFDFSKMLEMVKHLRLKV